MSIWEGGLYSFLIFIALVFFPCFLWNLWLAPYRILEEQINRIDENRGPKTIKLTDFSGYIRYQDIELYGAACLWEGFEPHYPIKDSKILARLGELRSAVRKKVLSSKWGPTLQDIARGVSNPSLPDDYPVSIIALRKYADSIGDVPVFLQHVSVPSAEEKKGQGG